MAWPRLFLCIVVAAPFIPAGLEIVRQGVPEMLFKGDGGVIELRTLFAGRGIQLVGTYSRFIWSHPGPAFFYLALPFYQAFHQRGAALHVFVFVAHFAAVVALVLTARRMLGGLYGLVVAALLAVYEMVGAAIPLWGEWNPVAPVLPLALLSFLAARIASGGISALPGFAFVASAIVQTHVGYTPVTLWLCVVACLPYVLRLTLSTRLDPDERRRALRSVGTTAAVLIAMWILPVYENATTRPGNLRLLWDFFMSSHKPEHTWGVAVIAVADHLAIMPLGFVRLFGPAVADTANASMIYALASIQLAGLIVRLAFAIRRRDDLGAILSLMVLGEIIVAVVAVRAIRGELHGYLLVWISVLGLIAHAVLASGLLPAVAKRVGVRATNLSLGVVAVLLVGLGVKAGAGRIPLVYSPDRNLERFARDVEIYLRYSRTDHPIVSIASHGTWPETVGLVLSLVKHKVPVFVAKEWVYMFGRQLAPDARPHPRLLVGDAAFAKIARARRDRTFVAAAGDLFAFLEDPDYLRKHRVDGRPVLLSATGAVGDPQRAVDGVVPPDGADWQSPLSVVLGTSSVNALEIAVPREDLAGVFLSVDGNDTYVLRCIGPHGESSRIGETPAKALGEGSQAGMRTRMVFSDSLPSCRSIEVTPEGGDGLYSIGEVGFLRR